LIALANYYMGLWCFVHQTILDFTRRLPENQCMRIRAEELLCDPQIHLQRITDWLGLQSACMVLESMLHPERWPFAKPGPAGISADGDPKFFRDPHLRRVDAVRRIEFLKEWGLNSALSANAVAVAERLGYTR